MIGKISRLILLPIVLASTAGMSMARPAPHETCHVRSKQRSGTFVTTILMCRSEVLVRSTAVTMRWDGVPPPHDEIIR
jgi:hypothetical protein